MTHSERHRLRWGVTLDRLLAWASRLSVNLDLSAAEWRQLAKLPLAVQRAVKACRRKKNRYWKTSDWLAWKAEAKKRAKPSAELKRRMAKIRPPRNPPGAGRIVDAVARAAGCAAPSLYRWRQEARRARLIRKRPRGWRRSSR